MAVVIKLRRDQLDAMIAHALEDAPIECCGVLAAKDGVLTGLHRAKNVTASPYRFEFHPLETRRLFEAIEDSGADVAGFYHSHTGSEPKPSPTDIRAMGPLFGPPYIHFVIGVADRDHPIARVFHIHEGAAIEHAYEVMEE
jgi:[CysO sulfur-carrier protein]-S-L-cysteine hydrolase